MGRRGPGDMGGGTVVGMDRRGPGVRGGLLSAVWWVEEGSRG